MADPHAHLADHSYAAPAPAEEPLPQDDPAPGPVNLGGPAPEPVNLGGPAPAPVNLGGPAPGPVNLGGPAPGPMNLGGPAPGPVNLGGPAPAPVNLGGPAPGPVNLGGPAPAPVNLQGPAPAPVNLGGPAPAPVNLGGPDPAPVNLGGPAPAPVNLGGPAPAPVNLGGPAPAPVNLGGPAPAPVNLGGPAPGPVNLGGPAPGPVNLGGPALDPLDLAQPGPAHENVPRPSETLSGGRDGSSIYCDGNGYYYYSDKVSNNRRSLRCIYRRSKNCQARASMGLNDNSPIIPTRNSPLHNHRPNKDLANQLKLKQTLKTRAREERRVPLSNIFAEEASRSREAAVGISKINALRSMYREKRKTEPAVPQSCAELNNILNQSPHLNTTEDGRENFYLGQIADENGEVVATGFGSRRMLDTMRQHPAEASNLFLDATFKVVPRRPAGLRQLLSIHVLYMNVVFPVIFFLMNSQTEEAYCRVLQFVRINFITWEITTIMTDFEKALINACQQTFQNAQQIGCWFHFCQAIWRSVIRFGLTQVCIQNEVVMRVIKMIMALPHLPPVRGPPNDVVIPPYSVRDGLRSIMTYITQANLDQRLMNIVAYVRRFWLQRMGAERFSVFNQPRRTNNYLEGFHSRLLASFGPHCNIWVFITRLQRVELEAFDDLERLHRNAIEVRRNRIRPGQENSPVIREAVRLLTLREITLAHFLRRCAHQVDNLIDVFVHPLQGVQGELWEEEVAALNDPDDPDEPQEPAPAQQQPGPAAVEQPLQEDQAPPIPPLQDPPAPRGRGGRGRPRGGGRAAPRGRGQRGRPRGRGPARGRGEAPARAQGRGRGRGRGEPDPPAGPPLQAIQNCAVCLGNASTHIAVPCGHLCMCEPCALQLPLHQDEQRCPVCNLASTGFFRIYF